MHFPFQDFNHIRGKLRIIEDVLGHQPDHKNDRLTIMNNVIIIATMRPAMYLAIVTPPKTLHRVGYSV